MDLLVDLLPLELFVLIVLELPFSQVKKAFHLTARTLSYYRANKLYFWKDYYQATIDDRLPYFKHYRNLKYQSQQGTRIHGDVLSLRYESLDSSGGRQISRRFANQYLSLWLAGSDKVLPSKAMCCAVYLNRVDLIEELITAGATNFSVCARIASHGGHQQIFDLMVDALARCSSDPPSMRILYDECIGAALRGGHYEFAKKIIALSGVIDAERAALSIIIAGDFEIFKFMIKLGARDYHNLARLAVMYGRVEILEFCLQSIIQGGNYQPYAIINIFSSLSNNYSEETAEKIVDTLEESKIATFCNDCYLAPEHFLIRVNNCLLHSALRYNYVKIVDRLLPLNGHLRDPSVVHELRQIELDNCLYHAACSNNRELISYFISEGATDFNKAMTGILMIIKTPLELIDFFISLGADNFSSFFRIACSQGQLKVVKHLAPYVKDLETLNIGLANAACHNHVDILEFLISHGATDIVGALKVCIPEYAAVLSVKYLINFLEENGLDLFDGDLYQLLLILCAESDDVELYTKIMDKISRTMETREFREFSDKISDVVEWHRLLPLQTEEFKKIAIRATERGNINILKALIAHCNPSDCYHDIIHAADNYGDSSIAARIFGDYSPAPLES